ncbi:MAG TPA: MarC family protein [Candidatus Desulfofervidus auxilii]|nr:MarC family protein [Candidatus Desulfofervidus auxilii]
MEVAFIIKVFVSIFIIVDPIGLIPGFVALTAPYSQSKIKTTVWEATLTLILVLTVFTLFGKDILNFFGITIPAFKIAGGIIIFMIAWQMLQAKQTRLKISPEEEVYSKEQEKIGIVPLGIPMLAGPGAITTVIVLSGEKQILAKFIILGSVLATAFLTYFILLFAKRFSDWLGPTGLYIFTRLMGLILAAIAVQFVIDGIRILSF